MSLKGNIQPKDVLVGKISSVYVTQVLVPVDDTLTKTGNAADAKATGEALKKLSSDATEEFKKVYNSLNDKASASAVTALDSRVETAEKKIENGAAEIAALKEIIIAERVGSASGTSVVVDDVAAEEHSLEVTVASEEPLDLSSVAVKCSDTLYSTEAQTATANAGGTVTGLKSIAPNMALWTEYGSIKDGDVLTKLYFDTNANIDDYLAELPYGESGATGSILLVRNSGAAIALAAIDLNVFSGGAVQGFSLVVLTLASGVVQSVTTVYSTVAYDNIQGTSVEKAGWQMSSVDFGMIAQPLADSFSVLNGTVVKKEPQAVISVTYSQDKRININDLFGDAVLYSEQSLTPEQQAQARKNIGLSPSITIGEQVWVGDNVDFTPTIETMIEAATFDESMLNPNNLLQNPVFNGWEGWETRNGRQEIRKLEGKPLCGMTIINEGSSSGISQIIPIDSITSGRYVIGARNDLPENRYIKLEVSAIGNTSKVIHTVNIYPHSPYTEIDIDKEALLSQDSKLSVLRLWFSYGWRGEATFFEPYFAKYQYGNNGFYAKWWENSRNAEANPLTGKIIAFVGDSICEGAGDTGGYAKYIGESNGMTVENRGRSGGTVAYSAVKASEQPTYYRCISREITNLREDADYIILEGGVNDLYNADITLGSISNGYNATLDDTTVYGAFENMLKQALIRFPGKKIGYIAVHKMGNYFSAENTENNVYRAALECCAKWGIPVCDLNISCPPFGKLRDNETTKFLSDTYTANGDGWHPNEEGYLKYYVPKIEAWLKTL